MKIAVVGPPSGFVEDDISILRFLGATVCATGLRPLSILRTVGRADLAVVWFLGEHAAYAVMASRSKRIPSVLILGGLEGRVQDGLWERPWHVRIRARWAYRKASEIWTVAPHVAVDLARYAGTSRPFQIVPTTPAILPWRNGPRDIDAFFVCNERVGRLKGLPTVLAAEARTSGLVWSVNRALLPRPVYASLLGRSRILVNASSYEGLNNTVMEGMASGCTPVLSDIPGNRYSAGDFDGAIFFPVGDADALANAVLRARGFAEETRTRAREYVLRRFPRERRVDAFRRLLEA